MTSATTRETSDVDGSPPQDRRPWSVLRTRLANWLVREWTTPTWIRTLTAAAVLMTIVVVTVISSVATTVGKGVAGIGHQAAPQVATSADLSFALSDMDTQLANLILAGNDPALAANRKDALDRYDQRREQVDADLQLIAGVSGADPAALQAVRSELDDLGRYQASAAAAAVLTTTEGSTAGQPSKTVLDLYRPATDLMSKILRTAHDLTTVKHAAVDRTYEAQYADLLAARLWVSILGGLLLALLVGLQVYLRVRVRRRVNPAIAIATVTTGVLVVGAFVLFSDEASHLTVAEHNAFASIVSLSEARALSYDANASESRYLLDPSHAAQYEQAFQDKSHALADYFATELKVASFSGQRQAAEKAAAAYQAYERDDGKLRALAGQGDVRGAIAFNAGAAPGNPKYDFAEYDKALVAAISINQNAFDAAIHDGETELGGWTDIIPTAALALLAALVLAGVWPRLAEYR